VDAVLARYYMVMRWLFNEEFVVSEVHPHWRANLALLTRKSKRDGE
jgi:hypothetical protein